MSLPLSGQLGSAQLGAAQLGQLSSGSVGAGFPIFFPDSGALKETPPPKKKKPKKAKKLRLPKKQKPPKPVKQPFTPASEAVADPIPAPSGVVVLPAVTTAITLALQEELYRQERLRATIAEDDELLLLLTS